MKYRIPEGTTCYRRTTTEADRRFGSMSETWQSFETTKEVVYTDDDIAGSGIAFMWEGVNEWFQFVLPPAAKPYKLLTIEKSRVEHIK
jgi:hypothetical protein